MCSPVGKVLRIVVFRKGNVVHSMVEFDQVDTAVQAKRQLHGCDIYSGCCTLKVRGQFAVLERKEIFYALQAGLPEPPFLAGAGAVFFGPAPTPTPTLL